jgi:hypothetical protein
MPTGEKRYTVRGRDSLSLIAARFNLSIQALVDANAARYPSLRTRPGYVEVGWVLDIPIASDAEKVLFVGMNPTAPVELRALEGAGVPVVSVTNSTEGPDKLRVDGEVYDLSTPEGALAFTGTLGLEPDQSEAIARVLWEAPEAARDELGQIARVFAPAEKGETIPSRLVLSGHSVGNGVWGDENGTLTLDALGELARVMPLAARAIQDVHVAGCHSGGRFAMLRIQSIFPKIKTIWAYAGSAPGAESGAVVHESMWERATRGEGLKIDRNELNATRKGKNVAIWTVDGGYDDGGPHRPIEQLRYDYAYFEPILALFESGEMIVADPQVGELRDYYNIIQALLAHPELPADARESLEVRRDKTIRLLFYAVVAPRFASFHAAAIRAGYMALGLSAPNYGRLARRDAMQAIDEYSSRARVGGAPEAALALADLLERGLRDLDQALIPDGWV